MACLSQQRGFTLFEILIVVFVIGMVLTAVSLTITPSEGRKLENEAKRIYGLMQLAKEEAIFNSQQMAFNVTTEGYGFRIFSEEGWLPIEEDKVLRNRNLPETMRMELTVLGEEVALTQDRTVVDLSTDDEEEQEALQTGASVFFFSSGEMTPFELFIHYETEENGYVIKGGEFGELEYTQLMVTL